MDTYSYMGVKQGGEGKGDADTLIKVRQKESQGGGKRERKITVETRQE